MAPNVSQYSSERAFVDEFWALLQEGKTPWGQLHAIREFSYVRGRADVVAVDGNGHVIAFEAKLTDWRGGLHQAYRNTCFAHQSYVLVPPSASASAEEGAGEFARRAVGLCSIECGSITVHVHAARQEPLQPWLAEQAITLAQVG